MVEQRRDEAGTGYPTKWEDQEQYHGGWEKKGDEPINIKSTGKARVIPNIFHNPYMPSMDDYYEPWTYDYQNLFNAERGSDQPIAKPISMITGEDIKVEAGPNWDDDLGGSQIYAANDPNLEGLSEQQRLQLSSVERLVFFYLPRICNHCLNPCCVASCPVGRALQAGRRWHCTDRSKEVSSVAQLCGGLPVQEDVLQLVHGQERKVHSLLSTTRSR